MLSAARWSSTSLLQTLHASNTQMFASLHAKRKSFLSRLFTCKRHHGKIQLALHARVFQKKKNTHINKKIGSHLENYTQKQVCHYFFVSFLHKLLTMTPAVIKQVEEAPLTLIRPNDPHKALTELRGQEVRD